MILHICIDYIWNNLFYELISRIQKNDINNIVYVPMSIEQQNENMLKNNNESYTVVKSPVYHNFERFFFIRKESKIFKDVQKKIELNDVKLIHAHNLFSAGYIAYRLSKNYNIKYIVAVRNTDVNGFFKYRKYLKWIGIKVLKNAEKIIFISESHRKQVFKKYIPKRLKNELYDKTIVLHNGISSYWLQNKYEKIKYSPKSELELLQVGKLDKNKNYKTTIKVYKELKKKGLSIKLNIVGKGKEEKKLKQLIGKDENVIFHGQLPKEELIKVYRKSDIFVLPSRYETFGLVYAEALTQSLPIIYTRGQGFDGVFKEGEVGYSVKYNSVKEIEDNINKIIKNYSELSKKAYINSDIFNWDYISKEYENIYINIK